MGKIQITQIHAERAISYILILVVGSRHGSLISLLPIKEWLLKQCWIIGLKSDRYWKNEKKMVINEIVNSCLINHKNMKWKRKKKMRMMEQRMMIKLITKLVDGRKQIVQKYLMLPMELKMKLNKKQKKMDRMSLKYLNLFLVLNKLLLEQTIE